LSCVYTEGSVMLLYLKLHHFYSKQCEAGTLDFNFCGIGLLSPSEDAHLSSWIVWLFR